MTMETKKFQLLVGRTKRMIDEGATEREIAERLKLTEDNLNKVMEVIHTAELNRQKKVKTE